MVSVHRVPKNNSIGGSTYNGLPSAVVWLERHRELKSKGPGSTATQIYVVSSCLELDAETCVWYTLVAVSVIYMPIFILVEDVYGLRLLIIVIQELQCLPNCL